MKNILRIMGVIITMTACQNKPESNQTPVPFVPVTNNAFLADTAKAVEAFYQPKNTIRKQKASAAERIVYVPVYHQTIPETSSLPPIENSPVVTAPVVNSTDINTVPATTGAGVETTSTIPRPEEKKGWSKAAKGAAIGAGTGAIGGAILSRKKKGLGAVIGGVVGAAGGYVIGKGMDKKDDRFIDN